MVEVAVNDIAAFLEMKAAVRNIRIWKFLTENIIVFSYCLGQYLRKSHGFPGIEIFADVQVDREKSASDQPVDVQELRGYIDPAVSNQAGLIIFTENVISQIGNSCIIEAAELLLCRIAGGVPQLLM